MVNAKAHKGLFAALVSALVLVALASVFAFATPARADYKQPTDSNFVNPNYLFDTGIKLNPEADTSGFSIKIVNNKGEEITPPSGFVRVPASAEIDNQPYRSKDAWTSKHYMFMHDNAGRTADTYAFWFDDPDALKDATIQLLYPNIGTYYGEPVGMTVDITNVVFMRHPFSEAVMHKDNSTSWSWDGNGAMTLPEGSRADTFVTGPAMIISTLPQYGIFQWNIHQDDFDVKFYRTSDDGKTIMGDPIKNMEDLYLTYSSLSVYPLSLTEIPDYNYDTAWPYTADFTNGNKGDTTIMQFEKVKALSTLSKAYVTDDTHVYHEDANGGERGNNDSYKALGLYYPAYTSDKTYWLSNGDPATNGKAPGFGYTTLPEDESWPYYWTVSGEYYRDADGNWVPSNQDNLEDANAYNDRMGTSLFTRNSVSLQYADSADIRFRMNTPDNSFWYTLYPQALTSSVPGRPEIVVDYAPHKGVAAKAADALSGNGEARVGDKVTYTVSQQVNSIGQDAATGYIKLRIVANIPAGITLDGTESFSIASSVDGSTPQGEFSIDGNKVTYTFDPAWLQAEENGMPMIGETYTITVSGTVADAAKGKTLEATATTILNDPADTEKDNPAVTSNGRVAVSEDSAKLVVSNADATSTKLVLANRADTFTFAVEKLVPADAETVTFEDELENVLEVIGTPTIDGVAKYDVQTNGNLVTATTADATADRGKKVTLTIQAKIRDDVSSADLEKYIDKSGAISIPNTATVKVNDNPKTSNTVVVNPDKDPVKKVNKVDHVNLQAADETFEYTIDVLVPEDATKIVISDTIEDVLEFVGKGALEGATGKVDTNGQTITATVDPATSVAGKTITLKFTAKVRDGADLSKYADNKIPNKASYAVNDDPKRTYETNTVTVTPPPSDPNEPPIVKKVTTSKTTINNKHGDLASLGEEYTYTIETKIPENAKGFKVTDTIDDVLAFVGAADVKVGGKTLGTPSVSGQTLTVTFSEAEVADNPGAQVVITFKAKINVSDEKLVAKYADRTVPNKASYIITNLDGKDLDPKDSNTVTVTPPKPTTPPLTTGDKDPVGSVRVEHRTVDGEVLIPWEFVQENQPGGTPYETADKGTITKDGKTYKFVRIDTNYEPATGAVVANKTLDVVYLYEPVGSVRVQHVTTDGTVLKDWADVLVDQPGGTAYTTNRETFKGYRFVRVNTDDYEAPTGEVVAGTTKLVQYVYEPISPDEGDVVVRHITADGKILKDWEDVIRGGEPGTPYTTNQETFKGYRFVRVDENGDPANGEVEGGTTKYVTYIYEPYNESDDSGTTGGDDPNTGTGEDPNGNNGNGGNNNGNTANSNPNNSSSRTTTSTKTPTTITTSRTTPSSTPTTSSTVRGLSTNTADASSFAVLGLGVVAIAAFGMGAFSLRRRRSE